MERFTSHTGVGLPLRRSNVDTDQILPSKYLKRIARSGFEDALFAAWRQDPEFILNQPAYATASILVAGTDFGTGSSREPAVWALQDYGFKVVIASRFGDIFRNNAGKSGLVALTLSDEAVGRLHGLLETQPETPITVDLNALVVTCGDLFTEEFTMDAYTRRRLLNGLDDIEITLDAREAIAEYEAHRLAFKPRMEIA
jgi:3-isopropylmalate/(R)-2-methylmalate dehydratase small subunit